MSTQQASDVTNDQPESCESMIAKKDLHSRTDNRTADKNQNSGDGNTVADVARKPGTSDKDGNINSKPHETSTSAAAIAPDTSSRSGVKTSIAYTSLPSESSEYKLRREKQYQRGLSTLIRAIIFFGGLLAVWMLLNFLVWN